MTSSISSSFASSIASNLFSRLDSTNKGYLEKSDLSTAYNKVGNKSDSTTSVDDLFSSLDSNNDGKVTKDEFSSALQKLADNLDSQFNSSRVKGQQDQGDGAPPPPPPTDDQGFTKDELTNQLSEIGTSDSKRSSLISNIVKNFDKADTNGDGKVSFSEAIAYDKSSKASSTTTSSSSSTDSSSSATDTSTASSSSTQASAEESAKLLKQILDLAKAYSSFDTSTSQSSLNSLFSTSA